MSGSPPNCFAVPKNTMASRKRIYNIDHNCFYDSGVITLGISNCAIAWVEHGISVRCLTDEERREAQYQQEAKRMRQAEASQQLPSPEIPGLKFRLLTKYRRPREAYDDMELPLCGHFCRWPKAA